MRKEQWEEFANDPNGWMDGYIECHRERHTRILLEREEDTRVVENQLRGTVLEMLFGLTQLDELLRRDVYHCFIKPRPGWGSLVDDVEEYFGSDSLQHRMLNRYLELHFLLDALTKRGYSELHIPLLDACRNQVLPAMYSWRRALARQSPGDVEDDVLRVRLNTDRQRLREAGVINVLGLLAMPETPRSPREADKYHRNVAEALNAIVCDPKMSDVLGRAALGRYKFMELLIERRVDSSKAFQATQRWLQASEQEKSEIMRRNEWEKFADNPVAWMDRYLESHPAQKLEIHSARAESSRVVAKLLLGTVLEELFGVTDHRFTRRPNDLGG